MAALTASVGKNGINRDADVRTVQELLRAQKYDVGSVDGIVGPRTINAITAFQGRFLHHPDGLISPGGPTWRRLAGDSITANTPSVQVVSGNWSGDSSKWTQEKKLDSLNGAFRVKVEAVLAALKAQKFQPTIHYGWRSVAVQQELFRQGRTKVKFSFHNAQILDGTPNAYAADIIDKRYAWSEAARTNGFWKALGAAAEEQGLVWGGSWASFPDLAHIQGRPNSKLADTKRESGL